MTSPKRSKSKGILAADDEDISRDVSSCFFQLTRLLQIRRFAGEEFTNRLVTAQPTGLLQRYTRGHAHVDHQIDTVCAERRCSSH